MNRLAGIIQRLFERTSLASELIPKSPATDQAQQPLAADNKIDLPFAALLRSERSYKLAEFYPIALCAQSGMNHSRTSRDLRSLNNRLLSLPNWPPTPCKAIRVRNLQIDCLHPPSRRNCGISPLLARHTITPALPLPDLPTTPLLRGRGRGRG